MSHTATTGPTMTQKYGGVLGHSGSIRIAPPDRIFAMVIARYNSGKSHFLMSNPNAYIINCDQSSVLQPDAVVWPVLDTASGRLIDADGSPMVLTYEKILAKRDLLVQLATSNQPRPSMVAVDTLTSFLPLLRDYATRNSVKLGLTRDSITDFKQMDGRASYAWMYDELLNFARSLRNVGYGFYYVAHIVHKLTPIKVGEEIVFTESYEASFTDSIADRLYPMFEMVMEVSKRRTVKEIEQVQSVPQKTGPAIEMRRKVTMSVDEHFLVTRNDQLPDGTLKPRIKMPNEVPLPEKNAWAAFEAEYLKNAQKQ